MYRESFFCCSLSSVPATTFKNHFIYNFVYVRSGGSPEWQCCWHGHSQMPQTRRSGRASPGEAQGNRQSFSLAPLQTWKAYVETIDRRFFLDDCSLSLLPLQRLAKPCLAVYNNPASLIQVSKNLGFLLLLQLVPSIRVMASMTKPCKTWQHMPRSTCWHQRTTCRSPFFPPPRSQGTNSECQGSCKPPDPLSHFTSPSYYKYLFKHLTT